ncbi:MAG: right-handed parallel beta-helix repeat-containing protein, partial [Candidatus Kerfeldbacteria bacterium]|nr:right-handed parallel beta-helix repeat-containing protein [Candidatus Kerfeldbacteria bacterium]
ETYSLTYRVDPEDISPAIFRLGPAKVGEFTEFRQWQIASDALITVSGTVFSNEGTTAYDCSATNLTINVRVNGGGTASGTCSAANGTYSVGSVSVSAAADVITTYVDANASVRAVTVTRAADATSNITGLDLYQNFLIVRHEDAGPITNTNLDQFDSGNDADVQFTVTTGALTVSSGQALHVWTGKSYSPGGTVTTNVTGGTVHINSSATLTAGGNLSIGGSWDNDGTFTAGTYTVTFTSTSAGRTLSGTLNGSSAFYKVNFNGTGGEWEVQDSMIVSAANATDTFLVSAGIATFGNSNGDTLEINGMMTIANTANQTATFQTAALAQGSTVTIDVNNNASPATCANCLIRVGASSGTGTGTLKIRKNAIVRLNARSTATVSDAGIEALSTGYLEIQGSQDDTGTSNGTTNETTLTDTSKSWTTDQHANKVVRITNTGSLAFGKVYSITSNTATALTRADNSTANATVQSVITTEAETKVKIICASVNSLITASNEGIGRYINDQTGTTGQLLIVSSTNDSASCTGSTDLFVVYPSPDALSILVASDTFDIVDGVRANDTFEILDYAHVTAEAGTACNAAVNSSGEGYIYNVAGSETLIQYAEICNLGRNASTRMGVETSTVNGNNTGEGFLINKSDIRNNYRGIRLVSNTNNSSANTEGVTNSLIHDNSHYGLELSSADSNYIAYNRSYDNASIGMVNGSGSDSNTWTGNYSYSNSSFGFSFNATGHTITSNYAFENTTENFDLNGNTMTLTSNWAFGAATYGFYGNFVYNSTFSSNTSVRHTYGIRLQNGSNDVISGNTFVSNAGGYGIFLSGTNDNTVISSNTVVDNGSRGINIQNASGTIVFSNTLTNNGTGVSAGQGTGLYVESNSGVGVDNTTLFNNDVYGEDGPGFLLQYSVASTGTRFINEEYGVTSVNDFDFRIADTTAAHEITMYNTTFASTEIHTAPSAANAYLMSKKHDGVAGAVRFWNDYNIPSDNAETPQDEDTEQYNYANNLWPDSITPHWYEVGYGAGTEDTDIQLAFNGAMGGDGSVYAYRVVCNAANCVTTSDSWDVYRSGTLLTAKASTGTQYTDSQADGGSAPNVRFTIGDAGTDYTAGATYTFVAYKNSGNTNTQKTITAMQNSDTFTVASGRTIELKGQSAGTNVSQVTRGATGGYSFIIGGTIDADAYSFNYLGGTGQASGLDINSGATITNLDNGSFDNFGTNVGTADSFIDIDSSLIGSGTPSAIYDAVSFTNTGSNANCAVNATGADATGYIQFTGSTGAFGVEANDCNDGAADADPGQIKWGGIRIKGTVYSDEGSTAYNCSTDNLTINASVNGGANTAVTCTASGGTYTIAAPAPSAAADPIVLSIDSVETPDATTATLAASTTAAISGFDLYQNRLVVRHENAGPMTNAKLSTGDNADAGIRYAVSAGALTVESGIELHIWNSKTFTPGGTVTT